MNFTSDAHYQVTVDIFNALGLPVREKENPQVRPSSQPQPLSYLSQSQPSSLAARASSRYAMEPLSSTAVSTNFGSRTLGAPDAYAMRSSTREESRPPPAYSSQTQYQDSVVMPNATKNAIANVEVMETARAHTSHEQPVVPGLVDDPLRRRLFVSTSTEQRPVSAPVFSDTLNHMPPPRRPSPFETQPAPKRRKTPATKARADSQDISEVRPPPMCCYS